MIFEQKTLFNPFESFYFHTMDRNMLKENFLKIRNQTEEICKPLEIEDYIPQPIMDASPPRWHLAHTTWFFETFILNRFLKNYSFVNETYRYLFNSYYNTFGAKWERTKRGNLSRPAVKEIYSFRKIINDRMLAVIDDINEKYWDEFQMLVTIGLNHEQQHQELLLTDIKYILGHNPLWPVYNSVPEHEENDPVNLSFLDVKGGKYPIGYEGNGFYFDNEQPVHEVLLKDFRIANRLITNGEYLQFMKEGGYDKFEYWLDEGWAFIQNHHKSPLYWHKENDTWYEMTLNGFQKLDLFKPVTHVNFYEAEAYAQWAGKRLLTEFEWEIAARSLSPEIAGNFVDSGNFHPAAAKNDSLTQMHGDCWEWTYSSYHPYPGYKAAPGALGEYNGKFMVNQMVLRGGSCATPRDHYRMTYRNFFHPDKQFQFSGIRLAEDL